MASITCFFSASPNRLPVPNGVVLVFGPPKIASEFLSVTTIVSASDQFVIDHPLHRKG